MKLHRRRCTTCGQHQLRVLHARLCDKRIMRTRPTRLGAVLTWGPCRGKLMSLPALHKGDL